MITVRQFGSHQRPITCLRCRRSLYFNGTDKQKVVNNRSWPLCITVKWISWQISYCPATNYLTSPTQLVARCFPPIRFSFRTAKCVARLPSQSEADSELIRSGYIGQSEGRQRESVNPEWAIICHEYASGLKWVIGEFPWVAASSNGHIKYL